MLDDVKTAAALEVLLKQQLALFKEVRAISLSQKNLLTKGDADALLLLINEKQTRLEKIDALEKTAKPYKEKRDRELDAWSLPAREKIDPLIRELQATLSEIVGLEEESRLLGAAANGENAQRVGTIQRGKAMLNAYGKAARGGAAPRYSDKQG